MIKNNFFLIVLIWLLSWANSNAQTKIIQVEPFTKVIVSPHIQVNFVQGDEESVTVEDIDVAFEKLNVEVDGRTLHVYLEGAKTVTKSEKVNNEDYKGRRDIYNGTVVKATITYKNLEELSLRGEEDFVCKSRLQVDKFQLTIYGESEVTFKEVDFNDLQTTIYGESELNIESGIIGRHRIIAYGESEINTLKVETEAAKLTVYGEAELRLNVSKDLKITAYGEANVEYKGDPVVNKGIIIGDASIRKIN